MAVDVNIDRFLQFTIKKICEDKLEPDITKLWCSMTRQMFKNYSYEEVFEMFCNAYAEASDEQWFEHKYPKGFFNEEWVYLKPKGKIYKGEVRKTIDYNLKISQVADNYGLKPLGKLKRVCPFHADKDPSLSLSDEKNVFNCFGCHAKGDIIDFIGRLEDGKKTSN